MKRSEIKAGDTPPVAPTPTPGSVSIQSGGSTTVGSISASGRVSIKDAEGGPKVRKLVSCTVLVTPEEIAAVLSGGKARKGSAKVESATHRYIVTWEENLPGGAK